MLFRTGALDSRDQREPTNTRVLNAKGGALAELRSALCGSDRPIAKVSRSTCFVTLLLDALPYSSRLREKACLTSSCDVLYEYVVYDNSMYTIEISISTCTCSSNCLRVIVGRFEFEGAYRATLRYLRQSKSESVNRTRRGLPISARMRMPDSQARRSCLSLSTISSMDSRIRRRVSVSNERAQKTLEWLETVRIAQASEAARLSNPAHTAAAASAVHDSRSPTVIRSA